MVLITCARSVHAAGSAAKERKAVARICRSVRFSRPTATGGALSHVKEISQICYRVQGVALPRVWGE